MLDDSRKLIRSTSTDRENFEHLLERITDVPESGIDLRIPIDEVGITNQSVNIEVDDLLTEAKKVPVLCNITLLTNLGNQRGIHMSRCGTAIFDATGKSYSTIDEFAAALAERTFKIQPGELAMAVVSGEYLQEKSLRLSGVTTQDRLHLYSQAKFTGDGLAQKTGVRVYHMTGCPCTVAYTKHEPILELKKSGFTDDQIETILRLTHAGSHTQRGTTKLMMDKTIPDINSSTLYAVLADSTHLVSDVLK